MIKEADTFVNAEICGTMAWRRRSSIQKAKPKETKATIKLDKALTGRDLKDGIQLELYEGNQA